MGKKSGGSELCQRRHHRAMIGGVQEPRCPNGGCSAMQKRLPSGSASVLHWTWAAVSKTSHRCLVPSSITRFTSAARDPYGTVESRCATWRWARGSASGWKNMPQPPGPLGARSKLPPPAASSEPASAAQNVARVRSPRWLGRILQLARTLGPRTALPSIALAKVLPEVGQDAPAVRSALVRSLRETTDRGHVRPRSHR